MKLVYKLTAAYFAATCGILAVNAVMRVRREVALFESHAIQDDRSLGRALRSSVLAVWRTEGEESALALVDEANRQHGRVNFRWVWLNPGAQLHVDPSRLAQPNRDPVTAVDESGGTPTRYTYVTVPIVDGRSAALEIAEPLDEQRAYVRKTIVEALFTTLALVVVCGLVAMALGVWLVGRPIGALVAKARRIGAGDFGAPLPARGDDELSVLAVEMNAMCEHLVEARSELVAETSARVATIEQLRHADRLSTVGKLASGIAHELGTPLNVIAGHADMIERHEVDGDAAVASARVIHQSAERVTAIIRQLLDFARRRGPQRAQHALSVLAAQTFALLRTLAEKKRVTVAIDGDEVSVDVDAGQLQQALTNLLVNAIQAVPSGGHVAVRFGRENIAPRNGAPASEHAFLRVTDDGPGIEARDLPHVFDPFFTTKDIGEGTGLGLSVTHGIALDHGGFIDLRSELGHGSTFTIYLPITSGQ